LGEYSAVDQSLLELLPYFMNNPMTAVIQKNKPRTITDSKNSGLNSLIDKFDHGTVVLDGVAWLTQEILSLRAITDEEIWVICEDITAFYRIFCVRLVDRLMQLVVRLNGELVMDNNVNFGNLSSPFLTSHVLDLLCYIFYTLYKIRLMHYLDNLVAVVRKSEAARIHKALRDLLDELGFPTNDHDRYCGPHPPHLGFLFNTISLSISIPDKTLRCIIDLLRDVLSAIKIEVGVLRTLLGKLLWASNIIVEGMPVASRIWHFSDKFLGWSKHRKITLPPDCEARKSLEWFQSVLLQFNGTIFFSSFGTVTLNNADCLTFASDSSHIGAAFLSAEFYGFWKWCPHCYKRSKSNIMLFELLATLTGFNSGIADECRGKSVVWVTDSLSGVGVYKSGTGDTDEVTAVVQELRKVPVIYNFVSFLFQFVSRRLIPNVDLLTRGDDAEFLAVPGNETRKKKKIVFPSLLTVVDHDDKGVPIVGLSAWGSHA